MTESSQQFILQQLNRAAMSTQKYLKEGGADPYQLGKSKIISGTYTNIKMGVREDSVKVRNQKEVGFDLDPEWKSKHLAYTLKPKTSGIDEYKSSFISKEAPSTCPTSIKSLDCALRDMKEDPKHNNPQSRFNPSPLQTSQKYLHFNIETLSEHRRQTLYNPLVRFQEGSLNKLPSSNHFRSPLELQLRTPQHSKNRPQKVTFFDRYLEQKNDNKNQDPSFSKLSVFKSYYEDNSEPRSDKKEHSFPNMKTVESQVEEDEEDVNSSIVIMKCLSPKDVKEGIMFKSHLKSDSKKSQVQDLRLRRKTTSDIKEFVLSVNRC